MKIDPNDLREWAIQIARSGHLWLPEVEKSRIRAALIYDLITRADAAEGRAPRPAFAEAPNVVPFAGRRDTRSHE